MNINLSELIINTTLYTLTNYFCHTLNKNKYRKKQKLLGCGAVGNITKGVRGWSI